MKLSPILPIRHNTSPKASHINELYASFDENRRKQENSRT